MTHLNSFRFIETHSSSFELIWVHLSSFKLILAHASLVKFYLAWTTFGRSIPLWREGERELRFINLKALLGSWVSTPTQEGRPFFLDWSFEPQFNSSSHTLSEAIGKWVLQMWGVRTLWGATIADKITKLKIHIPNVAYCFSITITKKWDHVSLFLESKNNFLIRLHSSTFVYTRLVTRLHSSTFVYICLWLVFIRLHSSSHSSVFLE